MKKLEFNTVVHIVALVFFLAFALLFTAINCKGQSYTAPDSLRIVSSRSDKVQKLTRRQEKEYQAALHSRRQTEAQYTRADFLKSVADQKAATVRYERNQPPTAHKAVRFDGLTPSERVKRSSQDR